MTSPTLNYIYKYERTSGFKICTFWRSTEADETADPDFSTSCQLWRPTCRYLNRFPRFRPAPVTFVPSCEGRPDGGGAGLRCGSGNHRWAWWVLEASCPPRPVWDTRETHQPRDPQTRWQVLIHADSFKTDKLLKKTTYTWINSCHNSKEQRKRWWRFLFSSSISSFPISAPLMTLFCFTAAFLPSSAAGH